MTYERRSTVNSRRAQVVAMVAANDGVTCADIRQHFEMTTSAANEVAAQLVRAGRLFVAKAEGMRNRYFTTRSAADTWLARQQVPGVVPAPVSIPMHALRPVGAENRPAGLRPSSSFNWTHDPRYQCAPGEQPYGAGFSAVGIGRSVITGKAW